MIESLEHELTVRTPETSRAPSPTPSSGSVETVAARAFRPERSRAREAVLIGIGGILLISGIIFLITQFHHPGSSKERMP